METTGISKDREYVHYHHSDECRLLRWNARESYEFMYSRPWNSVLAFYADLVAASSSTASSSSSLASLFRPRDRDRLKDEGFGDKDRDFGDKDEGFVDKDGDFGDRDRDRLKDEGFGDRDRDRLKDGGFGDRERDRLKDEKKRSGRWARLTFKVVLAYDGSSFDGWQKQPHLNTVQGLVESSLAKFSFVHNNNNNNKTDKGVAVSVAGRTDKGVTALRQVCSFYSWRKHIELKDIEEAINSAAPAKLTVKSVSQVSRAFHPNFSAKWRRYLYIFPLDEDKEEEERWDVGAEKPQTFRVGDVNRLLQQLEGKVLSYKMFARDTKAARNVGPPTECFMYHARAVEARLPPSGQGRRVMCVELVANRFLRKMVRVVVATAIREAAAGAEEEALVKLMEATCRRATAPPAPAEGLCLVDVGYADFQPHICLIQV